MLILLGDYNAKIGKEEEYIKEVAGKQSLHNVTNDNSAWLGNFAASQGLWISSISFPHKNIHKQMWKLLGIKGANQIDHVVVDKRYATSIIDVRTYRGADCDSNNFLVVGKVRQRIANIISKNRYKRTFWHTDKMITNTDDHLKYRHSRSKVKQQNA